MKKLILGAALLCSMMTFSQKITKRETISEEGVLKTVLSIEKSDGVITSKYFHAYALATSNQFDGIMSITGNQDPDKVLIDLKKLRDLSATLENQESTVINKLRIHSSGKGLLYIFQDGYAGFVSINTKQLDKLIKGFEEYISKNQI